MAGVGRVHARRWRFLGVAALEVSRRGGFRHERHGAHGAVVAKRLASILKRAAWGQAVGNQTRMRAAPSTTRAAILSRCRRRELNSALAMAERFGAAARRVWSSQ